MDPVATLTASPAVSRRGRSTLAVLAGFITILVTHTGTDALLHAAGVFPEPGRTMSDGLFALAAAYRAVFSVLGAYVAARLAPSKPMQHALALGSIGVALSLIGLVATLTQEPELGPVWYPLVLVVTSLPICWLGARLARSAR